MKDRRMHAGGFARAGVGLVLLALAGCIGVRDTAQPAVRFEVRNLRVVAGPTETHEMKSGGIVLNRRSSTALWREADIVATGEAGAVHGNYVVYCEVDWVSGGDPAARRRYPYVDEVIVRNGRGRYVRFAGWRESGDGAREFAPESLSVGCIGYVPLTLQQAAVEK